MGRTCEARDTAVTQAEQLKKIQDADAAYYGASGRLLMTDAEYDALRRDYIEKYGAADLDYVPTADLGQTKFTHPDQPKSLGKIDETQRGKLVEYIEKFSPVVIEPKLDGCSVVVYPRDGKPMYVTRGGGDVGDILPRFPRAPRDTAYTAEYPIRGEVYMDFADFAAMNEELAARGEKPMANPRNSVNPILTGGRHPEFVKYLSFEAYDIMGVDWSETEKMDYIEAHTPFAMAPKKKFAADEDAETIADEVPKLYDYYEKTLGYPIDGVVIKCDWDGSLEKFGTTEHHNSNAIAWKPAQIPVETTVTGVHWQLGKAGTLTPVADVEPVTIQGSVVSNVNLHNMNVIGRLGGIAIGDRVGVIKAKMIIPQIVIVYEHKGGKAIEAMTHCPYCGAALEERENNAADEEEKNLYCVNPHCGERIAQQIAFLAKRDVLDIDGLSIDRARALVGTFLERAGEDGAYLIFTLSEADIKRAIIKPADELVSGQKKLEKLMGDGLTEQEARQEIEDDRELLSPGKLHAAIQGARDGVDLPHFVKALLLDNIGSDIGKKLGENYGTLDAILHAEREDVEAVKGIGAKSAAIICSDAFRAQAERLAAYIQPEPYITESKPETAFTGKVFVLTGKMPHPRNYYKERIEAAGGKVGSAVSGNTAYLVIADTDSQSTKAKKARALGTKLLSPEELEQMLAPQTP